MNDFAEHMDMKMKEKCMDYLIEKVKELEERIKKLEPEKCEHEWRCDTKGATCGKCGLRNEEKSSKPSLAERLDLKFSKMSSLWSQIEKFEAVADEAKKAFEELINNSSFKETGWMQKDEILRLLKKL